MKKVLSLLIAVALTITLIPQWSSLVEASSYGLNNPRRANGITTWDCVWFGNYYQDSSSKKEPIKWRVLSVNGDDAFLLSDKVLDWKAYHTSLDIGSYIEWRESNIRKWLNNDFYNTAFDANEKASINTTSIKNKSVWGSDSDNTDDNVFLLSTDEICNTNYGFISTLLENTKTRECFSTLFAKKQGANTTNDDRVAWMLRTTGIPYKQYHVNIYSVACYGWSSNDFSHVDSKDGIRPAIHLKLSSNSWKKAGTVVSEVKKKTAKKKSKKTSIKKIKAKKRALKVYWKKASGANGYQLKYSLKKNFKKSKTITIKKTKTTSKTIMKLKRKKRYYVKIRTYYWSYGYKKKSAWSKVKSKKTK